MNRNSPCGMGSGLEWSVFVKAISSLSRIPLVSISILLLTFAWASGLSAAGRVDPAAMHEADGEVSRLSNTQARPSAAKPPVSSFQVTTTVDNFASPAGYLPLTSFTPTDVGATDESIADFTVPTFDYGGTSYDTIGITSNGYVVVGGGSNADVDFVNTDFPDTGPPNNVLAPFWTDLNPGAGGAVYLELLTDGFDSWVVVEWQDVPNFGTGELNTAQVWIGYNTDLDPSEDISFTYATVSGGDGGFLTVGAENDLGSSGDTTYFNGAGQAPMPSFGVNASCDAAWPGPPCYEVDVSTAPLDLFIEKTGALDLASSAPPGLANAGDLINYTFAVTNLSLMDLSNVLVSDPLVATITCPSGNPIPTLAAGVTETCTGSYAITATDIAAGQRDNTATASSDQFNDVIDDHLEPIPSRPVFPVRDVPTLGWSSLALLALILGISGMLLGRRRMNSR